MYYLLLFATLGQACSSLTGQWEVQKGDTIYNAANALQQDYRDIIKLNVKMPYKDLKEGSKYTVPYIEGVSYPATWSTSSCTPVLHLNILTPTSARSSESEIITESGISRSRISEKLTSNPAMSEITPTSADFHPDSTLVRSTKATVTVSEVKATSFISTPDSRALQSTLTSLSTPGSQPTTAASSSAKPNDLYTIYEPICRSTVDLITAPDYLTKITEGFCRKHGQVLMSNSVDSITELYKDQADRIYQLSASWKDGCQETSEQLLDAGGTCWYNIVGSWRKCNMNLGAGFRRQFGCIVFGYQPNSSPEYIKS